MRTLLLVSLIGLTVLATGCAGQAGPLAAAQAETAIVKPNASEFAKTIVTPHLEAPIDPNTNVMWCSTFQLAWNEMCDLAGGPLQIDSAPPMVSVLNKRTATRDDLDEASCLAMAGVGPAAIEKINAELARKFPGGPLARVPASPKEIGKNWWIAYAYLLKDLLFEEPFERSYLPMRFLDANVVTFGVTPYEGEEPPLPDEPAEVTKQKNLKQRRHRTKLNAQVLIYDYRDGDDFIVELRTKAKDDRLVLAKVKPGRTLSETVGLVLKRVGSSKPVNMTDGDALMVPIIDVDIAKRYDQLIGKTLVQARMPILEALQAIRFRLDEKGAQLMSLAYLCAGAASPHWMEFDKPYLVLLQRTGAKHPYFALWVANPELMTKVHVEEPPTIPPAEMAKLLGEELLQDSSGRLKGYNLDLVAGGLAETGKAGVPYLIKGLQSADAVVRKVSAGALARIGPAAKDAAEALAKAMIAEKDDAAALEMAGAIGHVGPPPAQFVPALLAALKERGNLKVSNYSDAMVALGPSAVPALVAAMESPDREVQYRAIQALGKMGPGAKGAIDALVKRMRDANSYFDFAVDEALAGIGTATIPAIMDAAPTGNQYHAAHAMSQMGSKAIPHLLAALKHDDPNQRAVAADALGQIEPPAHDAVAALIGSMKDPSNDVRRNVCEALARIGDSRALNVMLEAVKDRDWLLRSRAAEALGKFKPVTDETFNALTALMKDEDKLVRTSACESLRDIGDARALGTMLEATKDQEWDVRVRAAEALGKFKPVTGDAVTALTALLKDEDECVRFGACESLGSTGDARALDAILKVAKEGDSEMRRHAANALAEFKPVADKAVDALIALLKDKDDRVREDAIICLGKMGPEARKALPELDRISKTAPADSRIQFEAEQAQKKIASPEKRRAANPNDIFGPS
jgi:HEAT repeat protein